MKRNQTRSANRNQKETSAKPQGRGKVMLSSLTPYKQKPVQDSESSSPQKQSPQKQSQSRNRRSQVSQPENDIVFSKNTWVAFVDSSDDIKTFKLAYLIDDLREEDEDVLADIYSENAPLTYQKQAAKQTVFSNTIICDLVATEEKSGKKGAKPLVKITKQMANKANKLMDAIVEALENESGSEEDESSEDEESEEEVSQVLKGRKMIKSKKPEESPAKNKRAQSQNVKAVKSSQATSKVATKKAAASTTRKPLAKGKAKKESDEDMEEEGEESKGGEESEEASEVVKTSKTKAGKSKIPAMPKVGQKRPRTKKNKEESQSGGDDEGEDEEEDGKPVKKLKVGKGKEKVIKVSKPKKMPTEFKKGKWNPEVQLAKEDKLRENNSNDLFLGCCMRCNNKNVIRAAITENKTLLKKCMEAKKQISLLTAFWSPEDTTTALQVIIANNQHDLLETLLHPVLKVPAHSNYDQERENYYATRSYNPPYLMNYVDSGNVSDMAYGVRIRKVGMTRGNRQGNNAFLEYTDNNVNRVNQQLFDQDFIEKMLQNESVTVKTLQQLYKLCAQTETYLQPNAYIAVRGGHREIALELIKQMQKYPNFGFNQLHADVLEEHSELGKILRVSVTKKANTNRDLTPLHCACINPNPKYLKLLLDASPDVNVNDVDLRKPVHYAAACVGPDPLKVLIQAGASLVDMDNQKMNCLHIAAQTGRAHNVRTILETTPGLINTRDKKSMTALAYACKNGHVEAVKVLLEFKGKVNAGCGIQRMTPIIWAAAYGHYDLVKYLLENKGRVLGKDKFKRTALSLAARNGHVKILSLLLQNGSEWDHPDSSMNTPLHYAAAYGWIDCMNELLSAGANVNAANSWKITPINIAMLMNHNGCVKRLLEEPNVDVNGKDEKGRTLITLSLIGLNDESVDFITFLLKKGADPNIKDLEGQTSLHYLAKFDPNNMAQFNQYNMTQEHIAKMRKENYERNLKIQKEIAQILISNGADLAIKDDSKRTAFSIALEKDNASLLEFLQNKVSLNKDPELLFAFKSKIFNIEYQKILEKLIKNDPPTEETINYLNDDGLTPFLFNIQQFSENHMTLFTMIQYRINQQSFLYQHEQHRYAITNADLFDKFANQDNWYNYNQSFTQEQKNQLTNTFMDKIVVQPFIKVLQLLIHSGANPCTQVQKLKRYREKELLEKQLLEGVAEGEDVKMEKEEKVQRRDERMKRGKAARKTLHVRNGFGQAAPIAFAAITTENNDPEKFETRNGVKTVREYGKIGLRNAIHFMVIQPQSTLLDFLLQQKIDPDLPDYDEMTPFNLLSLNAQDPEKKTLVEKLIDLEVRIDYPDINGRTPFLNYFEKSQIDIAYNLLALGANVNQLDNGGLFALKYSLLRRNNNQIQELLDKGAEINLIDNKGRNLLHHAINMSSATADATFETEQFLLEKGVEINLLDHQKRTPLHYAFVKISNWSQTSQIDPIETVSSLCGFKNLQLDVPDKWLKTPLHYASQRGASICAMYLIQRGADMEKKDIYGNTALGVGLTNKHYNYGIILIQKQASVKAQVFKEDWQKLKKQWDEEEAKKKGLYRSKSKLDKDDAQKPATHKKKTHQNMFQQQKNNYGNEYDNEYDDEYDNEYDEEDEQEQIMTHHENMFNQQNVFGQQVFAKAPKKSGYPYNNQMGGFGTMTLPAQMLAQNQSQTLMLDTDEGVSLFKLAIRGGQQGLAYLMLDNGYDLMLAMQDAMDEKKFMLVLTLLSKNPDDSIVQSKNSKGQNLFHILSQNASGCSLEHLTRIYDTLKKRGVDVKAKDIFGRNALHYAVMSESQVLVQMLLSSVENYNPNEVDIDGHTPLSYCLRGKKASGAFYNAIHQFNNIFIVLAKSGADMNVVYPEKEYKPAFKEEDVDEQHQESYQPLGKHFTTALINVIRLDQSNDIQCQNIMGLMEFGAKLNVCDSDGRDPLMHAIMNNNIKVVKMLLDNKKNGLLETKHQDFAGKSAVHYVINPIKFGSYENVDILRDLHKNGFDLMIKDGQGKIPGHYAAEQESGVLLKELAKLTGQEGVLSKIKRATSIIDNANWPAPKVDFEVDAETYTELAEEKERNLAKDQKQRIPVDPTGRFEKSYQVYYDDNEKPWDVYLTKVDLKNGIYGDYVFYKMQLLYDTNRDLYVVFTRWGRIGESGMNQRSPFGNVDEAKKDFKTIFKGKTGGNDFERLDTFGRIKKKYNLAQVNYIKFNHKDYLAPFDYEKCPKTKLNQPLYDLFQEIANVTMYQKAMTQYGVDTQVMPFSSVKKETIIQARQILMQISDAIQQDIEISKEGIKADFEALTAVKEKISELTSRYYELIPLSRYRDQIAPPLNYHHLLQQQYDNLEGLGNIEYATKLLLGALYRQQELNPVDYVYNALNLQIEALDKESPEFEVILKYITNTNENSMGQYEIGNIFKMQRKGEAELIQAFKEVPNHFLLYHGSALFNFIGILSQGLRIAPPEAPVTGYMFGKGLYFADMFGKSFAYSQRGYAQQDSHLMLMCEVVLGKQKELYQATNIEKLEHPFHSVKGVGRMSPDYKSTVVLPNAVKIPYGKVVEQPYLNNQKVNFSLQHNEYIVYNTSQVRMRYIVQVVKKDRLKNQQ